MYVYLMMMNGDEYLLIVGSRCEGYLIWRAASIMKRICQWSNFAMTHFDWNYEIAVKPSYFSNEMMVRHGSRRDDDMSITLIMNGWF